MRHPDGSPAAGVPVNITVTLGAAQKHWSGTTDPDGAVSPAFNIPSITQITVKVSIHQQK